MNSEVPGRRTDDRTDDRPADARRGRPLSDEDYAALRSFRHALRVFLRASERAARDAGVTPAQHQLLLAVRGHRGAGRPNVTDVAEVLQLRHHSTVELIDRATDAGLVVRHRAQDDQRRQEIELTRAGHDVLERLSVFHRDELRRFRVEMIDILDELDR